MTWGVLAPKGLGEFSILGNYPEWDDKVAQYIEQNVPESERKLPLSNIVTSYQAEASRKFKKGGKMLADFERPSAFQLIDGQKKFGDLIQITDGLLMVSATLKELIEELEPGVHQFWRIDVFQPKGKEVEKTFFGLAIQHRLNAFSPSASREGSWEPTSSYSDRLTVKIPNKACVTGLALSRDVIGSAHLWRDERLFRPMLFLSDELKARIDAAGLRIPKQHYKTLDA